MTSFYGNCRCWVVSNHQLHGWLVVSTPLKNMKVSWDDYSQLWKNEKLFQTTNQMDIRTSHSIAIISLYLICTIVKAWYTGPLVISLSWMGFLTVGILTSMKMDWWPAPNNSANNPPISSKSWYIPQKSHEFPIKSPFFHGFLMANSNSLDPGNPWHMCPSQGALVGPPWLPAANLQWEGPKAFPAQKKTWASFNGDLMVVFHGDFMVV